MDAAVPIVVVAQSARALAEAAQRSGFAPVAVDLFADEDTRAAARAVERPPGGLRCGFRAATLLPAVERAIEAAGAGPPIGLVLGSGFEDRPRLIARLAARWLVIGCSADAVAAVKDPFQLAAACAELGIPHPELARVVPPEGRWILRRRGGTGGTHVREALPGPVPPAHVAQRRVDGEAYGLSILADGRTAVAIGACRQLHDPAPGMPWRFSGVVGPLPLPKPVADELVRAAVGLTRRFGLRGLLSLDVMLDGDRWWLLEVNPRPGAALDVLDPPGGGLLAAHVAAARDGRIFALQQQDATIRARRVVYAPSDSRAPRAVRWPDWVHDRPAAGTRLGAGEPIATVSAEGLDEASVLAVLGDRADRVTSWTRDDIHD